MSDDTKNVSGGSETQAAQLLEWLNDAYRCYMENSKNQESSKGITRLFKRWFAGYNPLVAEPLNQEFIDSVEDIVLQLASALKQLMQDDPALSSAYAAEAANLMLAPKPAREKTTAEWYLTVAEYQSAAILPYVSWEDLKQIRDAQLKSTPKRMMYPKQRELHQLIEKLIKDKQLE